MTGDSFIIHSLILVGGIPTPLKNIGQLGLLCPMYCMEHKKCEPPTSININQHITLSYESNHEFPRLLLLCSYLHQKSPLGGPTLQYLGRKKHHHDHHHHHHHHHHHQLNSIYQVFITIKSWCWNPFFPTNKSSLTPQRCSAAPERPKSTRCLLIGKVSGAGRKAPGLGPRKTKGENP